MHTTKTFHFRLLCLLASVAITACASPPPQLQAKSSAVPAGIDLSGLWQLRVDPDSRPPRRESDGPAIRIPPETSSRNRTRQSTRRSRGSGGPAVSVFLESGALLKITQTSSGLFISFDRAVVEEYRFGEDRLVSVGPIEAQRVSGWQDGRLVVETLDDTGARLTETWGLLTDGKVLLRTVSISKGDEATYSLEQRFDRV